MRLLQELVPGCNKVGTDVFTLDSDFVTESKKFLTNLDVFVLKITGKAMMLDEIINYVQSLQQQVEVCVAIN